jgi:hypothetical protein
MSSGQNPLKLVAQPQEYFYELFRAALSRSKFKPQPETEVYLLHLLNQFISTDALFSRGKDGEYKDEPLALLIKDAIDAPGPTEQESLFRHVGDVSLYRAGFFQASLNRKLVDLDYYIDMGGAAYRQVAIRAEERDRKKVFEELAHRFSAFVDVLAEMSSQTTLKSEANLIQMYEHWMNTKSERAEKFLKDAGILPQSPAQKSKKNNIQ